MKNWLLPLLLFLAIAPAVYGDDDLAADKSPCYKSAMDLLARGKQGEAEKLVLKTVQQARDMPSAFFAAVLIRSRFDVQAADRVFNTIAAQSPSTLEGQAAALVTAIDSNQAVEKSFDALDKLSKGHPTDPLLLWLVAIECRQLSKDRTGIIRYESLLKLLDPGPVLVHQTYGNLLLEDGQAKAALEQYDLAIKMEPAAWDYNCRGNALMALKRYDDAAAAYQKATELEPDYLLAWQNWALLCHTTGDTQGAAEKEQKAKEIKQRLGRN